MIREETKQELERFKNIHDNYSFTIWLYTLKKNDNEEYMRVLQIYKDYGLEILVGI